MIARGRFVRGNPARTSSHLDSHIKYIEHRSRELDETREDRHIFSKDEDYVSRSDAHSDVMEHSCSSVAYHKIILSPADDEPIEDWREWTREVMADLEDIQGKDLHWYAVHHQNTEHPHVHILLAGVGENWETGEEEPVKLYQEDYQLLRESGREHSEHEYYYQIETELEELHQQDYLVRDNVMHDLVNMSEEQQIAHIPDNEPSFDEGGYYR
jgi:hypothetical protein